MAGDRSSSHEVFVVGLALDQRPHAVFIGERVQNLTSPNLVHEVVEEMGEVDEAVALSEDSLAYGVDCFLGELLLA